MATEGGLRIGRYIVALLLLGTPATQPSFAGNTTSDAQSTAQHIAGTKEGRGPAGMHRPKESGSGAKGRDINAPAGQGADAVTKDINSIGAGARELNPRNAIGLPMPHQQNIGEQGGGRVGPPSPAQNPAATMGVVGDKPASFTNANGGLDGSRNLHPNPSPIVTGTGLSRGKIDGAGLIRPGIAPSGLGGPAKAFAGINGTTFRPKH